MTSLLYFQTPRSKGTQEKQQKHHTEEIALRIWVSEHGYPCEGPGFHVQGNYRQEQRGPMNSRRAAEVPRTVPLVSVISRCLDCGMLQSVHSFPGMLIPEEDGRALASTHITPSEVRTPNTFQTDTSQLAWGQLSSKAQGFSARLRTNLGTRDTKRPFFHW